MATELEKKKEPKAKEIIFKCRFCQESKPLEEMIVLTRFFPPIVACRGCARKIQ